MKENLAAVLKTYDQAKAYVIASGFAKEIEWQKTRNNQSFTESDLLRESAWVILCGGFKESVIRKIFDHLSLCFCDWESAHEIVENASICRSTALVSFNNQRKINGIISVAFHIKKNGFQTLKSRIQEDPIQELQKLPFIGSITVCHLAKNLGFNMAKPDRHMQRLSKQMGFLDAHQLCEKISNVTGDPIDMIDIVLWRYMAIMRTSQFIGTCPQSEK